MRYLVSHLCILAIEAVTIGVWSRWNSNSLTHAKRITINPSAGRSIILDDGSSYLICYSGIDKDNIKNIGFAVALSRASKERTGGILFIKSELTGINFVLDGNTLKVSTNMWTVMTLTKIWFNHKIASLYSKFLQIQAI